MKYTLAILVLCFAFAANAQINFGVSVSGGLDRFVQPNVFKYSVSNPDLFIECAYGIKQKKISFQGAVGYTPFKLLDKSISIYSGEKTENTFVDKIEKISIPLNINYSFGKVDSKYKFGISGGILFEYLFSESYSHKSNPEIYYNEGYISNLNSVNAGGQVSIFSLFKKDSKISLMLNTGCSFSKTIHAGYLYNNYSFGHQYKSEKYGLLNFFFKISFLFGK